MSSNGWRTAAVRNGSLECPSTPGYYVLDPRGVIRHKGVGAPSEKAIDTALEKLIHEAEANQKKPPM